MVKLRKSIVLSLVQVALILVPVWGVAAEAQDPKTLFEERCAMCHSLSRPLDKTKTADGWRETVNRMKGYAGGRISDAEAEIISDYLSETRAQ